MASPAVVSRNESATATASTTHNVSLPASLVSGNLIVVIMNRGSVVASFNALAGWTELVDDGLANGITVWYRVSNGAEGPPAMRRSPTRFPGPSTRPRRPRSCRRWQPGHR
jgi:hypothetical protein